MKDYLWDYWKKKIEKIEKQLFDIEQCNNLLKEDLFNLFWDWQNKKVSESEFFKLSTDLKIAYNVSYTNFRKYKIENSFFKNVKINLKSLFSFGK